MTLTFQKKLQGKLQILARKALQRCGVETEQLSLEVALSRCRDKDIPIQTVIDIGASNGSWSLRCRPYFSNAFYFLIEARHEHEEALRKLKLKVERMDYIICAAGDSIGEAYFDATDLFAGLVSHSPLEQNCIIVPITTVDYQVAERQLKPPYLLKLDTHGFEVPIFEGAKQTLQQTNLIVVETYNFNLTSDSLRFHEMCYYMEKHGFRCIDICEPMHRISDRAFWQMDLFFIRSNHKIFTSNSYR